MKRIIASGIGVLALGGFLAFQPVAGGVGGGGLTFTPTQPQASATQTPTNLTTPASESPQGVLSGNESSDAVKQSSGSGGAALQGTSPAQPPQISSGGRGDDDDDEGEDHHRERHHDEDEFDDEDGDYEGHDD